MLAELAMALDPALLMRALDLEPDPWQSAVLRSDADRQLLLAARQSGKSSTTAALALHAALFDPGLILMFSPSQRQSGEIFRKLVGYYRALGSPVPPLEVTATTLALDNGSRVVSLPGSHETVRGYSAPKLVIIDEASQVDDSLFTAVTPMLAVSRGRLLALSTPFGRRGWFHDQWHDAEAGWRRVKVTARDNPRIDPAWLAEQERLLGPRWFSQEFLCEFVETTDQIFATDVVLAAFSSTQAPLFPGGSSW